MITRYKLTYDESDRALDMTARDNGEVVLQDYIAASDYDALAMELAESKQQITSYQIAKDNLEMHLARVVLNNEKPQVSVFAGRWSY